MPTVFISGSLKIKSLDGPFKSRLDNIVASGLDVIVGDAAGVDQSVQLYLRDQAFTQVKVYCTGSTPRNNEGNWSVVEVQPPVKTRSRAWFTAKDIRMAAESDYGLMMWDGKSTGTLSNVIELLGKQKKSVVYFNPMKQFFNIVAWGDLRQLIQLMDPMARNEADRKIGLEKKLHALSNPVLTLF